MNTGYALAVHPICHPTMTRNTVAKVFDIESSFEARGEEASEGSNERGKGRHDQQVELIRCPGDAGHFADLVILEVSSGFLLRLKTLTIGRTRAKGTLHSLHTKTGFGLQ